MKKSVVAAPSLGRMPLVSPPQSSPVEQSVRFRIGTLLYFSDRDGRLLLIRRSRQPNLGVWCAVGGKLEMPLGESPYECAIREAAEEVGVTISAQDLSLRCILSEKDYEKTGHWLMFVFQVTARLEVLPMQMEEGEFRFFEAAQLGEIAMPELDREILMERILGEAGSLHVLRVDGDGEPLIEESRLEA